VIFRDTTVIPALIMALGQEDEVSDMAIEHLIAFDMPALLPVIDALQDAHPYVRICAALVLGRLGQRQAVESLIMALRDDNPSVRAYAAHALADIGDQRAIEPIMQALHDEEVGVLPQHDTSNPFGRQMLKNVAAKAIERIKQISGETDA
jgi:HEAT repeat protein